ncbi:hypothetical protein DFR24_0836 [Panacagrimonas perspica]|uniref:Phytase-like protein with esterase activity n=1 Tax=Panacagrimonas perspica TaxID=381431 RepID=A0A4S3K5A5_9GAMM|nr:hypothetical protein [Panacagrimonas perspica]TDU31466.1 hypothetical protein DFR24_0836 [Panacagrimonas perspica]THD03289.1 hypothetical protein B1810_12065 [Panacagrimonas perspica]
MTLPDGQLDARFTLTLSAASGIVLRDGIVHVMGDDRGALDRFLFVDGTPLAPIALIPGDADADAVLAKPDKPDLEALVDLGDGSLLALGSGSRANRERGFRIGADGVQEIDLSPLYARLRQDLPNLNIEGAARVGFELVLAHRGVGKSDASCLVRLDASKLLARRPSSWTAAGLIEIRPVALGQIDGVALAFTDLATDADGTLHYLAAAEDTDDPYLDGACRGSVIGRLTKGSALPTARLRPDVKAEGLAFLGRSVRDNSWAVVTDADDPGLRAKLYELRLPR